MKKLVYIFLLLVIPFYHVYAFDIDINKLNISEISDELAGDLDKTYNIETKDFDKRIVYNNDIKKIIKEFVNITLNSNNVRKDLTDYLYISDTNGFDTLTGSMFIEQYSKKINEMKLKADGIKNIRTITFQENDYLSFAYLQNASINGEKKDVVLSFWLKEKNNTYKLFYPWMTVSDDLQNYFDKVSLRESNGNNVGGTYNKIAIGENKVNDEVLRNLYNTNKDSAVQITGMSDTGSNMYGSGFFLREGIVVTTWSLFLQFLTNSNYIFINDANGNTYDISGIVAAQIDYDVVILKLNKEVGKKVVLGNYSTIKDGNNIFMINSKENTGFSITYGNVISQDNGRLKNMFLLSEADVGAALFDNEGNVIGFNVADSLYSDLSFANSTDYLKDLQSILEKSSFNNINAHEIDTFKRKYYTVVNKENKYNNISEKIWNKYKSVGNVEEKINLELVKATYVDGIVSLRYKNNISNMINGMYLVSGYENELIKDGYKRVINEDNKLIYANNKYKVIIKNYLDYLIILIVER